MMHGITHKLGRGLKDWIKDESGNTTIDWVVLVSSILVMTLVVMGSISGGVRAFGQKAETELTQRQVGF